MKKVSLLLFFSLFILSAGLAQQQVALAYFAKKVKEKTYEIRVKASIAPGWYIYANHQLPRSIAQPTEVAFARNPLISLDGNLQVEGKLEKKEDGDKGVHSNIYQGVVSFVQFVTLTKSDVSTNLEGTISFQACNSRVSMPPESRKFTLMLQ